MTIVDAVLCSILQKYFSSRKCVIRNKLCTNIICRFYGCESGIFPKKNELMKAFGLCVKNGLAPIAHISHFKHIISGGTIRRRSLGSRSFRLYPSLSRDGVLQLVAPSIVWLVLSIVSF